MQINAIYTRSVIQTMAGKAIRDLRSGGERELRNVVELCKGRSSSPDYQRFWSMLENILRRPNQQYGALLSRAANDVDINCLKTLFSNLGLHAFTTGREVLQNNRKAGTSSLYWMEAVDGTMEPDLLCEIVSGLQQQGVSSFLFRAGPKTELETVLNIAGKHRHCMFFLICQGISFCQQHLEDMTTIGNVIPLIGYEDIPVLAGQLKQAGILFGLHRRYEDILDLASEEKLLLQCIGKGCFLGVYEGGIPDFRKSQDLFYYAKLQEVRQNGTKEIFLADLWRDREVMQKLLLHPGA